MGKVSGASGSSELGYDTYVVRIYAARASAISESQLEYKFLY